MRNPNSRVPELGSLKTPEGSRIAVQYEPRFDGEVTKLVKIGEVDIHEQICSWAPYTDLNYMLTRLSCGDTSHLSLRTPMYADVSGLPNNMIDAINLAHSAENKFSQLPVAERAEYNNDWQVYLMSLLNKPDKPVSLNRKDDENEP